MSTPSNPDLYAPCPCGSGKKYKFCCFAKKRLEKRARHPALERAELLIERGARREALTLVEKTFREAPVDLQVRNTLAMLRASVTDFEGALALVEETWRTLSPGNPYTGGLLARLLLVFGRREEARVIADQILDAPLLDTSHAHMAVLALAVLDDDRGVLSLMTRSPMPHTEPMLYAQAMALLNTGALDEAVPVLRALYSRTQNRLVKRVLDDAQRGRVAPTLFGRQSLVALGEWLPGDVRNEVVAGLVEDPTLIERYPIVIEVLKSALDIDPKGAPDVMVLLASAKQTDLLRRIAEGTAGSDELRRSAAIALVSHGLVAALEPFSMVIDGERKSVVIQAPKEDLLDGETYGFFGKHARETEAIAAESHALSAKKVAARWAKLAKELPLHPVVRFNVATTAFIANQIDMPTLECQVRAILDDHPDYLFARAMLARQLVSEKRIEEAEAVLPEERLAVGAPSEWIARAALARGELLLAKHELEAARPMARLALDLFGREELFHFSPALAMLAGFDKLDETQKKNKAARTQRRRSRHLRLTAQPIEWLADRNVEQLRALAERLDIDKRGARAPLLARIAEALATQDVAKRALGALTFSARRAWRALVEVDGIAPQDEFLLAFSDVTEDLENFGLVTLAAVDGEPRVVIPPHVGRALGVDVGAKANVAGEEWIVGAFEREVEGDDDRRGVFGFVASKAGDMIAGADRGDGDQVAVAKEALERALEGLPRPLRPRALYVAAPLSRDDIAPLVDADIDVRDAEPGTLAALGKGLSAQLEAEDDRPYVEFIGQGDIARTRRFFDAAAELASRAPWTWVPGDVYFVVESVDRSCVVNVMGQSAETYGLATYASLGAAVLFGESASAFADGLVPLFCPSSSSVSFDSREDVSEERVSEVKKLGLRLAGPAAFPTLVKSGARMNSVPLDSDDVAELELACRVVCEVVDALEKESLGRAEALNDWAQTGDAREFEIEGARVTVRIGDIDDL